VEALQLNRHAVVPERSAALKYGKKGLARGASAEALQRIAVTEHSEGLGWGGALPEEGLSKKLNLGGGAVASLLSP